MQVFAVTGKNPLLETAMALHDHALKDDYFKSRNLYPVRRDARRLGQKLTQCASECRLLGAPARLQTRGNS